MKKINIMPFTASFLPTIASPAIDKTIILNFISTLRSIAKIHLRLR